jgi:hypothetical protein
LNVTSRLLRLVHWTDQLLQITSKACNSLLLCTESPWLSRSSACNCSLVPCQLLGSELQVAGLLQGSQLKVLVCSGHHLETWKHHVGCTLQKPDGLAVSFPASQAHLSSSKSHSSSCTTSNSTADLLLQCCLA